MTGSVRRGEIWIANVPGDKRRPVLVLTRSSFIERLNNVTVAPIVSRVRDIPTEIVVGADHGIDHRRAVSLDNVLALSKHVLVNESANFQTPKCSMPAMLWLLPWVAPNPSETRNTDNRSTEIRNTKIRNTVSAC